MLRRTITFENPFTEQEVTEEHYFHISKADLVEMELEENAERYSTKDGRALTGMEAKLARIIEAEDGKTIMAVIRDVIRRSYGKKIGDRFVKSKEAWEEFESSEAHSQLLFELCTDADKAAEFTNGVLPGNLAAEAAKMQAQAATNGSTPGRTQDELEPAEAEQVQALQRENLPQESRVLTVEDLENIDPDELKAGLANGKYRIA